MDCVSLCLDVSALQVIEHVLAVVLGVRVAVKADMHNDDVALWWITSL